MDPRHEFHEQEILNYIINTINAFLIENTDEFLADPVLQEEVLNIGSQIYVYLGTQVDVAGILSKHNLLSIDVVLFPLVSDVELYRNRHDKDFPRLLTKIKAAMLSENKLSEMIRSIR